MKRIAIVGGGFSGTTLAARLLCSTTPTEIVLFEKSGQIGAGLAYGTDDPSHLLNVPASRMSALDEEPQHFANWLASNRIEGSEYPDRAFVPRLIYRQYLQELINGAEGGRALQRVKADITSLDQVSADAVVLATGYLPESNLHQIGGYPPFSPETWPLHASQIVLVGSGLTAADVALTVAARYPEATITILSRSGALPEFYDLLALHSDIAYSGIPAVREMTRWLRHASRADNWQSVFNAMRPQWETIWQSLSPREQERFLSRLRSLFDRHRHRMPPATASALTAANPILKKGILSKIQERSVHFHVNGREEELDADLVIDCSGQSLSWARTKDPLYQDLFRRGARSGPHGLGIEVDATGRVAGVDSPIYAIGPMRKGSSWETTAVAELRRQVAEVAEALVPRGRSV